jgi:hypothetical protein
MGPMRCTILKDEFPYTGRELRRGWIQSSAGIEGGDAAVAWVGPCRVETADLVDMDDAASGAVIEAARMAHVIVEHPGCPLQAGVLRQRLLVCILGEVLRGYGVAAVREGDDLYVDGRKLTVSVAAPSPGGCMIHLGINVDPAGAPVPCVGLGELGAPPFDLLEALLEGYREELSSAAHAETKVRSVP